MNWILSFILLLILIVILGFIINNAVNPIIYYRPEQIKILVREIVGFISHDIGIQINKEILDSLCYQYCIDMNCIKFYAKTVIFDSISNLNDFDSLWLASINSLENYCSYS
jgi:hypothetical protein